MPKALRLGAQLSNLGFIRPIDKALYTMQEEYRADRPSRADHMKPNIDKMTTEYYATTIVLKIQSVSSSLFDRSCFSNNANHFLQDECQSQCTYFTV